MVTDFDPTQDKDSLTALAGKLTPQALDQHLRSASDGIYYPAQMTDLLRAIKQEAGIVDGQLREAAQCSAYLRRTALARPDRQHDKEGSFAYVVIPNRESPEDSLVVKIHRNAATGQGLGSLGGLIEAGDGGDVRPKRELIEELVQEYDLPPLQNEKLLQVLEAMEMTPLFTCRDDAHVIERGWGWRVNAYAHMAEIPSSMHQQAKEVFEALSRIKPNKSVEVDRLEVIKLKDLPARVPDYFYGHEAYGDMVSAQVLFDRAGIVFDVLDHYRQTNPDALSWMASKMYLSEGDLVSMVQRVREDAQRGLLETPGDRPLRQFTANDYAYACHPPSPQVSDVQGQGVCEEASVVAPSK